MPKHTSFVRRLPAVVVAALCAAPLPAVATGESVGASVAAAQGPASAAAARRFALMRTHLPRRAAPATADTTPPQLTRVSAGTSVNATGNVPQLRIHVTATDAETGVYYIYYTATGPQGQTKFGEIGPQYPAKQLDATLALHFARNDQPGTWTITDMEVGDDAGNWHDYGAAQLAALGNTTFTVTNPYAKYLDSTAPVVTSGKVLSPVVGLTQGGMSVTTTVGVQVQMSDAGNPTPRGVHTLEAYFCIVDGSQCIQMQELNPVEATSRTTLRPATVVYANGYAPGDYVLFYLHLFDWGSNETFVVGKEFGGDTDFSTLFPAGHTIRLLP